MSVQFWPCPGCSRHVKRGDATCPFCGASASAESSPTRTLAGRLSRAALFAAGAAGAAVATTNCSAQSDYGGPPVIHTEDSSAGDAVPDAADASAATGPTDSSTAADVPMAVPFYGAAPPK
jgi:hypothetical protein